MRSLFLITVLLFCSSFAHGSIARGGTGSGTTSATPSSSSAFQLELAAAVQTGTTGATVPTGSCGSNVQPCWTQVGPTITGTTSSIVLACRVEYSGTAAASGTFTNATNLGIIGYTGTGSRDLRDCGVNGIAIGATASTSGTSTTASCPALTLTNSGGTSWVACFIFNSGGAADNCGTTPSGMSAVSGATTGDVQSFDTNGSVTNWSAQTCTLGASGNWIGVTVEVIVPPANPSEISQLVWSFAGPGNGNGAGNSVNGYRIHMDPALSGNTTLLALEYPEGAGTPTITDNGSGNTWTSDKTCSNGTTSTINLFRSSNTSIGTSLITVTFSAATYMQYAVVQLNGIATSSPVDNSVCNARVTPSSLALGNLVTSAFTTTSSGDFIFNVAFDEYATTNYINPVYDVVFNSGWTGISAPRYMGALDQAIVQSSSGSITSKLTVIQTTFDPWDTLAVAYKTSSGQGTATAYGVRREQLENFYGNAASTGATGIVFPCASGNFIVGPLIPGDSSNSTWGVTPVVDTASNTWNLYHPATLYSQMYYSNSSATCNGQDFLWLSATNSNTVGNAAMYEIVNALASGAYDSTAQNYNGMQIGPGEVSADATLSASVTSTTQTSWSVGTNSIANGTYEMIDGAGEIIQVVSGGGTSTLTVARGQWGSTPGSCSGSGSYCSGGTLYYTLMTPLPAITTTAASEIIFNAEVNSVGPIYDSVNCTFDYGWGIGLSDNNQFANGDMGCHQYEATAGTYNVGAYLNNQLVNPGSGDGAQASGIAVKLQSSSQSSVVRRRAWVIQ
jgi:hypothetical protein